MLYLHYNWREVRVYRIAIEKLFKWKQSKYRAPLIIEGACHVGRTWLMKESGRHMWIPCISILTPIMAGLFAFALDTERLIMRLELYAGRKIDHGHFFTDL